MSTPLYDSNREELTPRGIKTVVGAVALAILIIVALLVFFGGMFRVVGVGQVGILSTFGNIVGERQSGVTIKAPWQKLVIMDIKTQKEQVEAASATQDLQTVNTTVALNYHLTSGTAQKVYREVGEKYQDVVIDPILQESIKAITAQYIAEALTSNRSEVATKLNDILRERLTNRGITVDNVSIVNLQYSAEFDQAIEQKQVAQQNAQKAQYNLQTAQQDAQAQDVKAKTLTPEYLQLQAIEKWDGKMPSTYSSNGGNLLFNIPAAQ